MSAHLLSPRQERQTTTKVHESGILIWAEGLPGVRIAPLALRMRSDERRVTDAYVAWLEQSNWTVRREIDFIDVCASR